MTKLETKLGKLFTGKIPDLSGETKATIVKVLPWIIAAYCCYDLVTALNYQDVQQAFQIRYVPFGFTAKYLDAAYRLADFVFFRGADIVGLCAAYLMYHRVQSGWRIILYLPIAWLLLLALPYMIFAVVEVRFSRGGMLNLVLAFFFLLRMLELCVVGYIMAYFLFQVRSFYTEKVD